MWHHQYVVRLITFMVGHSTYINYNAGREDLVFFFKMYHNVIIFYFWPAYIIDIYLSVNNKHQKDKCHKKVVRWWDHVDSVLNLNYLLTFRYTWCFRCMLRESRKCSLLSPPLLPSLDFSSRNSTPPLFSIQPIFLLLYHRSLECAHKLHQKQNKMDLFIVCSYSHNLNIVHFFHLLQLGPPLSPYLKNKHHISPSTFSLSPPPPPLSWTLHPSQENEVGGALAFHWNMVQKFRNPQ